MFPLCTIKCTEYSYHKVQRYKEYRAVSGVFRTIDPPPHLHQESVSSPRTKGGVRGWGVNILEDARHWIGLLQYNPSTIHIYDTDERIQQVY